jgi:RND superfamily putative drug exporter
MQVGITGRIARAAATRPWLTLGVWAVIIAVALGFAGTIGEYVTPEQRNLIATEANRADAANERLRTEADGDRYAETVIVSSASLQMGDSAFDAVVTRAKDALAAVEGVSDIGTPGVDTSSPIAPNGHAVIIGFTTDKDDAVVRSAMTAIDAVATPQVDALVYGHESAQLAFLDLASEELARGETIGVIAAFVILLVVFGAVVAAGLPLAVAIVSILAATALGAIVARILTGADVPVSDSLTIFIAMLGLALGVDYSLLAVQRFREELHRGRSVMDAVTITGDSAGRAVALSGATVVIALGGLLFVPLNTFLGIGIGVMAVALASVSSALFLLPAVLRLLGHRVNTWRLPRTNQGDESRAWRRVATAVANRPRAALLMGVAGLLLLAAPVLSLRFAQPSAEAWPADFVSHRAADTLTNDFGWTESTTLVVVSHAAEATDNVQQLADAIAADPGYATATVDWRGDTAFIDVRDAFASGTAEARATTERLRRAMVPAALAGTTASAAVGGAQAYAIDETRLMESGTPWAVAFILCVSFVFLMVTFRSLVIPLKAITLNLLGTLATFGVLVAVYQWGWGESLGFPHLVGISPYMPVMIFALVFGLSMDYHVFLLTRIKEHHDATGDNRAAVIEGVTRTGPLITGAALIMIAVFGGFAVASIPELSQWGLGLAIGVLVDATIIRCLLVPAAMVWLAGANWYLPGWLQWLPRHRTSTYPQVPAQTTEEQPEPALV